MASHRNEPKARRRLTAALAVGLTALCGTPVLAGSITMSDRCRVPDTYLRFATALERTGWRIGHRSPVRIYMLGPLTSTARFETELERRLPGINVEVTGGQQAGLADDDFEMLRTAVARLQPDLVIWQVGVRDALASSDVGDFEGVLDEANTWLEHRGVDLVLMDPPFVPHIRHERIYTPYVGEIGLVSRTEGVPVLRRYAAMQYWSLQREKLRAPPLDARALQPCVNELLAEAISRAAGR
jgi:hypothetical protein